MVYRMKTLKWPPPIEFPNDEKDTIDFDVVFFTMFFVFTLGFFIAMIFGV